MRTTVVRVMGADAVTTSGSGRQWFVLGVHLTAQAVFLVLVALGLTCLVAAAVLSWLERTA